VARAAADLPAEEPLTRARRLHHTALAAYWFGLYALFTPVGANLAPSQISDLVTHDRQPMAQGLLLAAGAVFAVTVPPLVGAWSDRLTTPWGRRRPIMVAGTVGTVVSLGVMATARSYPQLLLGYVLVQFCSNAGAAAYSALIPDVVPAHEVGNASGMLSVMLLLGSAAGLGANVLLSTKATYSVIGLLLVVSMVPALWAAAGEGINAPSPPRIAARWGRRIKDFLGPMLRGDFGWVVLTRLMVTAGISAVSPFTQYFFRDVAHVAHPEKFNAVWLLLVLALAMPGGLLGGRLSDRQGRKRFVYASGGIQAAVAIAFIALYPSALALVLIMGGVYGIGYGLYTAVDWALAVDTLPDRGAGAKDMGLFHVALSLPGSIVPAIAGYVLGAVNGPSGTGGYRVVFGSAAVFFVLGTVFVSRIRSVR